MINVVELKEPDDTANRKEQESRTKTVGLSIGTERFRIKIWVSPRALRVETGIREKRNIS